MLKQGQAHFIMAFVHKKNLRNQLEAKVGTGTFYDVK